MVKLIVLYGKPEDPSAFDAYYASTHAPLADKIPNCQRYEHGKALHSADGSEAPYYYVADLTFEDADALQAGMSSPEGEAAGADVANFATGGATMFIAEA
jgi:uncharacterized protein (TIGR02118 family)